MNTADQELLLSRVVDRLADQRDWDALMTRARTDATLWEQLALALRDDDLLRLSLDVELAGVPAVEAPEPAVRGWSIGWRALSGWAAAALLALAWWLDAERVVAPRVGPRDDLVRQARDTPLVPRTAEAPALSGEQMRPVIDGAGTAADASLVVLGEVSRELLETRARADGQGIEVLYLRQELVREVVDEVFELARDELGQPRPVPVPVARLAASEVL